MLLASGQPATDVGVPVVVLLAVGVEAAVVVLVVVMVLVEVALVGVVLVVGFDVAGLVLVLGFGAIVVLAGVCGDVVAGAGQGRVPGRTVVNATST